ncbi:hypothetical protein HMPREF9714_01572 [Myroides odoratimimus CCUG 12901]|uniref:hypothetical protein n=1 Tax=Myroides odoratimimus TaxID=76832 RepID=UPI0002461102|nr:hypothetical protein [Myroides odoratimimus]EHO10608.1 hypothetical protein HMPREF9714_01572 [Myroides odoratimimus CCUG 12901]EPH12071.1 hypothetical protein HMPREF9713_01347 [Myroides odoratimimus CCUG 12700]
MKENILSVFKPQSALAFKQCWILLLLFLCSNLLIVYDVIESKTVLRFINNILFGLIFSWYFITNKQWGKVIITFIVSVLFFLSNTNYFFTSTFNGDFLDRNNTVVEVTKTVILILSSIVISYQYIKVDDLKVNSKQLLKTTIIMIIFLLVFRNSFLNNDILDLVIDQSGLSFIIHIIYELLTSMYIGGLLFVFYLLIENYQNNHSLVEFHNQTLEKLIDSFTLSFPLLFHVFILTLFYNIFDMIGGAFLFFYRVFTFYEFLKIISILTIPLILIIIISQILRVKANRENSFFGIYGVLLYVPIINVIFYPLFVLNSKYKIFPQGRLYTDKILNIIIGLLLLIGYFVYTHKHSYSGIGASEVISGIVIYIVGVIRVGKIWVVALLTTLVSLILIDLPSLVYKPTIMSVLKEVCDEWTNFIIVVIMKFFTYIFYYYILRYTFLTEEEWNE